MADTDAKTRPNSIYESDFFTWTQEQAQLLRERRFEDLDLDNLVDEVASVGSSEKREIRNRLSVLTWASPEMEISAGRTRLQLDAKRSSSNARPDY